MAVNDENEIMMITTEGIIIQIRMQDISTLSRITSGVKLMDLEDGVRIAKIAKVREKISDGEQEFDDLEDTEAVEDVSEEGESREETGKSEELLESGSTQEDISE